MLSLMSTRLAALSLLLVACAPASFRYVAVADTARQAEPRVDGDQLVVDKDGHRDLTFCREACGFAVRPGEEILECRRAFVSRRIDANLRYPTNMTVCALR